jgi:Mrp family chromosome partitioning ATPase
MDQPLPNSDSAAAPGAVDIGHLQVQLWRRRKLFVTVFCFIMFPAVAAILLWPPMFYAQGTVIIGNLEPADRSVAGTNQKLGDPADIASQLLIAKSPRMFRLALERPGVLDAIHEECREGSGLSRLLFPPDCGKLNPGSDELLSYISKRYLVQAEGRSRVISMGYQSPLPQAAFILANALLITYLEDQRAENAHAREVAALWVLKADKNVNQSKSTADGTTAQSRQIFYQDLYKKVTDLETERRDLPNPGRLVSLAEFPVQPASPKRIPLLAAGLAIATTLAGFWAVRRDHADRSIRRTSDIKALTSDPVLASMPLDATLPARRIPVLRWLAVKARPRISPLGAVAVDWESPRVADAARELYAQLGLSDRAKGRSILVASAAPGEGKTFTTMALARAAVESGRKVLVIDCDLRSPTAANFGPQAANGLASLLRGEIEPPEAVFQTSLKRLEVIHAGLEYSDPAALFIHGQLPKVMEWAGQYDLILLDGPSGFPPEMRVFASHAEGLLWCVRWGYTLLCDVKANLEDLHRHHVNLLGLVITMVDLKEMRHYQRKHPS